MSNKKLEALKALFKKEQSKNKENNTGRRGDIYPFWEMKNGEEAVVRLLPDKNPDNPYMFYVDKLEHTLPIDGKNSKIPCLQMYGEQCPICDLSREFYKKEGKGSVNGKFYYRKKTSIARVLVIKDPLPPDEETGENCEGKVMNTQLGYQLMEKIKAETIKPDMDVLPWDFEEGYNFTIAKTVQGDYSNYAMASGFARRSSAIPEDLVDEIELIDLSTLLPDNPGYEYVKRKLDAHLNGSEDGADEDEDEDDDVPVKPSRKPTRVVEEEDEAPVKPSRKLTRVVEADDEDEDEDDDVPVKPSRKPTRVVEEEDEDSELDDILAQVKRRNRNK